MLLLLFAGCASRKPEIFLGDMTCPIPCWYGLIPGKTTLTESQKVLALLPFVSQESFKTDTYRQGIDYLFWRFTGDASGEGGLYFDSDGRLQKIELTPRGLELGMTIDAFGPPESVQAFYLPPVGEYLPSGGEIGYALTLYYPSKGIVIEVRDKPRGDPEAKVESITRDLRVTDIKLFSPTSVESFLRDIDDWSQQNIDYILDHLQPWPGFGDRVINIESP
jgi:hypothetical protein